MPFYEYECAACHDRFVRQQRMTDPVLKECPSCAGPVRKVFNAPSVAVRGDNGYSAPACAPGGG